jgi:hypothetical protein
MSVAYSSFNFIEKAELNWFYNIAKRKGESSAFNAVKECFEIGKPKQMDYWIYANQLKHQMFSKQTPCNHYFFDGDGFMDWLQTCHVEITTEMFVWFHKSIDMCFLHYRRGDSPCFLVSPILGYDNFTSPEECKGSDLKSVDLMIQSGRSAWIQNPLKKSNKDEWPDWVKCQNKLALASLAYIQAFPDMVADGLPVGLSNVNHYRKSYSKIVAPSSIVFTREGPCPHYRSGHFRLLLSEKYTKKRGQMVFVKGTFVKGKAFDVLADDCKGGAI